MRILGYSLFEKIPPVVEPEKNSAVENFEDTTELVSEVSPEPTSYQFGFEPSSYSSTTYVFNGEKTSGELGSPINLIPDYRALRLRANEAELTSDVIQIVTGRYFKWVLGAGLKIQVETSEEVLELEGITEDISKFRKNVEAYFSLFAKSEKADHSGMVSLHRLARNCFSSSFIGGDSLVVLRLDENSNVTVQVIDGQHVKSPVLNSLYFTAAKERGNKIKHGIEKDSKGKHVAYYVEKYSDGILPAYDRIEAIGKESKCKMAWLVYGKKARIDNDRGISRLSAILEKNAKLDRYTEAAISSAEERAKVPWTIEHSRFSDGENPMLGKIMKGTGAAALESSYELGKVISKNISVSENKNVWNLPIDAKMKALDSQSEAQYDPFWNPIFNQICASVDLPPEVALQKYSSNYSASRAAINGWGFNVDVERMDFSASFYIPIFSFWLYIHILKGKVNAAGYLKAKNDGNDYVIAAYNNVRFTGTNMPHIDPKKEADAMRILLGDPSKGEDPLMSREQAAELLGLGEWRENCKKYQEEDKIIVKPKPVEDANSNKIKE